MSGGASYYCDVTGMVTSGRKVGEGDMRGREGEREGERESKKSERVENKRGTI